MPHAVGPGRAKEEWLRRVQSREGGAAGNDGKRELIKTNKNDLGKKIEEKRRSSELN